MNCIKEQGLESKTNPKQQKFVFLIKQNLELHLKDFFFQFRKGDEMLFSVSELKDKTFLFLKMPFLNFK